MADELERTRTERPSTGPEPDCRTLDTVPKRDIRDLMSRDRAGCRKSIPGRGQAKDNLENRQPKKSRMGAE